jgi:hypothetical protein
MASIFFIGSVAPHASELRALIPPGARHTGGSGPLACLGLAAVAVQALLLRVVLHGTCHPGNAAGGGF